MPQDRVYLVQYRSGEWETVVVHGWDNLWSALGERHMEVAQWVRIDSRKQLDEVLAGLELQDCA